MMFSTRSEYGVRVMIQLARRRGTGPVPLTGIAQAEALPLAYLEQLVSRLRKADSSHQRGAHTAAMSFRATRPRSRWPRWCRRSRDP